MCEDLVLAHPDFEKPFLLKTDASSTGVGAALTQQDVSVYDQVIAYDSQILNHAQQNYSTAERECYAIIYALEKFREYLDGAEFSIKTDNSALVYLDRMKNTNSRLMRWAGRVQEWSPQITYIKGRDNVVADFRSRNPQPDKLTPDTESEYMFPPIRCSYLTLTCDVDKEDLKRCQKVDPVSLQTLFSSRRLCQSSRDHLQEIRA